MFNTKNILSGLFAGAVILSATVANAGDTLGAYDKMFMMKASAANKAEIAAGKLAMQKTRDAKVRGLAQTIVKEHTMAQNELEALAKKHNVSLPMQPDAAHKAAARRMSRLSGNAFDNAYITSQIKDHAVAIKLFQNEMSKGKQSEVRDYAAQTLGHIQMHNDTIHKVAGKSANMSMMKMTHKM